MNGGWIRALFLSSWLVALDAWVKMIARLGACPGDKTGPWTTPTSCEDVTIVGDLALAPAVRAGLPGIALGDPLTRQLAALGVIAAVVIVTIAIARSRRRQPADLLAVSCLWSAAAIWSAPMLVGPGVAFTEFAAAGLAFGIGDLAMALGTIWLLVERIRA